MTLRPQNACFLEHLGEQSDAMGDFFNRIIAEKETFGLLAALACASGTVASLLLAATGRGALPQGYTVL